MIYHAHILHDIMRGIAITLGSLGGCVLIFSALVVWGARPKREYTPDPLSHAHGDHPWRVGLYRSEGDGE